jgi:hypothetical protein
MTNLEEYFMESKSADERKIDWLEHQQECLYKIRDEIMQSPASNPVTEAVYAILKEYALVP